MTAGPDHKERIAVSTENEQTKIVQTKIPKKETSPPRFYKKIIENSSGWVKFKNKFAETIAKSGIYITFKKGHRHKIINQFTKFPKERKMSKDQKDKIQIEINKLLESNIISKSKNSKIYPNHVFIISSEHRTTKNRLIFDMSQLNKSIYTKKFSMIKTSEIIPHLFENNFACTFDIKSAYFHIPINNKYKKYFSFQFNNIKYIFNAMPFGLSTAPYIFTKFISPILEYLRKSHNIIIFGYLDDFLLLAKSKIILAEAIKITIDLFESLGFQINFQKSQLTPSTELTFLGVEFNLELKTMSNSQRLISKVKDQAHNLINKQNINRIEFEKFIGLCNFMTSYMKNGRHFLHPIIKITNQYLPRTNRFRLFPNRSDLKEHLQHWLNPNSFQKIQIVNILPQATIEVDSSKDQWGATIILQNYNTNLQGKWNKSEKAMHINQKELLATLRALEQMPTEIQNMHIAINNDNRTAISTLAKLGSNRSAIRQSTTAQILQILAKRNCTFECHHIPGRQIVLADFLSRQEHLLPTEIQISQKVFHNITTELHIKPEVDLFATKFNTKLKNYHSSIQDKNALQVNTFTTKWSEFKTVYAFPPPNLIHKILYKWNLEKKGQMLIIAPDWPTKSWYSPLQINSIKKIRLNLTEKDLYLQTNTGRKYFSNEKFHLVAHLL